MLQLVEVGRRQLQSYEEVVGPEIIHEIREIAKDLKGLKVVHINATPYGGGVSEMLRSLVPLEQDLGLDVDWRVITGDERFFRVTKEFHNALQGGSYRLRPEDKETYLAYNIHNAHALDKKYDVFVVHDPQPAAMLHFKGKDGSKWIWRCHIDTSEPNEDVWKFLHPFISDYDRTIFTMKKFAPPNLADEKKVFIAPAIDPLSPKNFQLTREMAENIINWVGIPSDTHLIIQVSRFDSWKDPLGVIEVYKRVKKEIPRLQLALIGSMSLDDPQGWEVYSQIMKIDSQDPDLFLFTNLTGVSNVEVNAFQTIANLVIQKSIREGFGLVVSEALWKGTPVVAGRAGGIPMQIDGGGYVVDSIDECAEKVIYLLNNPEIAKNMGAQGKKEVKENFLLTRLLRDELKLLRDITHVRLAA